MKPTHILLAVIAACSLCACATSGPNRRSEDLMFESLHYAQQAHDNKQLTDQEYGEVKDAIIQKYMGNQKSGVCTDAESNK